MSDIFSVSSNAVNAYQRALGTVSNNIANVGTEGYVRQETNLVENPSRQVGNVYLGTGVRFAGVQRAYDQFLETNLRNSTSDLATQEPMVTYANRIVDIMGSDTVGLPPAMDKFFASARALSTDPASSILRGQFVRDADGLAARFRELSTQMDAVDTETRNTINEKISSINTLSGQLATINKQLARETRVDAQPAELMDQRDRLLTALSKLVKINVTTALNGSVNISIGNTASAGVILNGQKAVQLAAKFDETDLSRVAIIADPYGTAPETIAGVGNGELGGLLTFREQVLQPTVTQLDFLAQTVVDEVNAVHRNGIDANGAMGKNLFAIAPVVHTDAVSGETTTVQRAAAGIKVAFNDASKVAAGALFRVIENASNVSGVDASLSYSASYADPARVKSLSQVLANNPNPSAGINAPANQLLGQIPQGSTNWSLYLDGATGNQQMQVFTRDGRQLIGATLTDETERRALMTTANGFVAGSTYSDQYLNTSGVNGYKQISVFYGAKAEPGAHFAQDARFSTEHDALPTARLNDVQTGLPIPSTLESIPANTLSLNGKVLPALLPQAPAKTIQASDIAKWMNRAADGMVPTIAINASTTATVTVADPTAGMYINGIAVPADSTRDLAGLVDYINAELGNQSNVVATADGADLVLTNAIGFGGDDIRVGGMDADGNETAGTTTYKGVLDFSDSGDINIGYGPDGELGDFVMLGTPAGNYTTALLATEMTPAVISGSRIAAGLASIDAGAITLNGEAMPALSATLPATSLKASDLVSWFNTAGSTLDPTVTASGSNEIRTTASMINLTGSLKINGATISPPAGSTSFADAAELVAMINETDTSGGIAAARVSATLAEDGSIVLSNETGENITLGSTGSSNALGVGNGTYLGKLALSSTGEIKVGFGETGKPADLAKLGLRTGAYIEGAATEDLLVFVTGEGSATVAGSYDATMTDPASLDEQRITSLRAQKFDVTFTSATRYQITWKNPEGLETILAERDYDPKAGIDYQGLKLTLNNAPASGDKFAIDGNQDGTGNNQNMLELAAIETKSVIGGANGITLSEAYEEQVGKVGNLAGQASIAQEALKAVNDQAIESRDAVSGVSLDSEAADLIRFQQAYQACAKAMQVASTIFDAILAVR